MTITRFAAIRDILRPWYVKAAVGLPVALGTYDVCCNQFGWPKIPALWGMTGLLLPWWAWLLIAQAAFVYGLFEYVRRTAFQPSAMNSDVAYDDSELRRMVIEADRRGKEALERLASLDDALRNTIKVNDDKARKRLEKLETQYPKVIEDYQRMTGLEARLEEARDNISNDVANLDARSMANETALQAVIDNMRHRHEEHGARQAEEWQKMFDSILLALEAIGDRERLHRLAERVDELAEALSAPDRDPEIKMDSDAWREWSNEEEKWRSLVERWCELAEPYRHEIRGLVFDTPERAYRDSKWIIQDVQFPDSNAVHGYKSFRLIEDNWRTQRGNVDRRVSLAAFAGQAVEMRKGEAN
jgi:hypothetical protein